MSVECIFDCDLLDLVVCLEELLILFGELDGCL